MRRVLNGAIGDPYAIPVLAEITVTPVMRRITVSSLAIREERFPGMVLRETERFVERDLRDHSGMRGACTVTHLHDPASDVTSVIVEGYVLDGDEGEFEVIVDGGPFDGAVLTLPRAVGIELVAFIMPSSKNEWWVCQVKGGLEGYVDFHGGSPVPRSDTAYLGRNP